MIITGSFLEEIYFLQKYNLKICKTIHDTDEYGRRIVRVGSTSFYILAN